MQKYQQYCPVARASEIFADRWTPLIVRELVLGAIGSTRSSGGCRESRARSCRHASVERLPRAQSTMTEYHLSEGGRELKTVIEALGAWVVRWAFGDPRPEELDAALLVWKIHQRINRELLPERRTVVEFDFTGPRGRRVWLLLERHDVSVCVTPPGFDSDLIVRADLAFFYRVWLGQIEYDGALRCGSVVVEGLPALPKELPRWFMWSPMARFVRERERALAGPAGNSRKCTGSPLIICYSPRMTTRKILTALLLMLLSVPAAAETIQGRWKLIAAEDLRADGTVARLPWGAKPIGSIVVEGGACYVQIMSSDVPTFSAGKPVVEQMKAALLVTYIAYSGPCTIDEAEGSVTLKVDAAWRPDYVGTEQKRYFRFDKGRLIFGPAPNSMRGTGEALTRRLTLERAP